MSDALARLAAAADPALQGARPRDLGGWLQVSTQLGLEGLVPAGVDAGTWPADPAVMPAAVARMMVAEAEQAAIAQTCDDVLAVLAHAGIAAVPLKGPLLAARLYPPPLVRRSTDVDILIASRDLAVARRALAELGYAVRDEGHGAAELRHHHHLLLCAQGRAAVELHFDALHAFGTILPGGELVERARRAEVSRRTGPWRGLLLDPTDELLYLAVHAAAHNFERPLWSLDVGLFAAQAAVDWDALWHRARTWHLYPPLVYALRTAARQLGDASLAARLPPESRWEAALHRARQRLRPMPHKTLRRFALDRACLVASCDGPWRAAWLAQYTALRTLGTAATRWGVGVPQAWPPWPPQPPPWPPGPTGAR